MVIPKGCNLKLPPSNALNFQAVDVAFGDDVGVLYTAIHKDRVTYTPLQWELIATLWRRKTALSHGA